MSVKWPDSTEQLLHISGCYIYISISVSTSKYLTFQPLCEQRQRCRRCVHTYWADSNIFRVEIKVLEQLLPGLFLTCSLDSPANSSLLKATSWQKINIPPMIRKESKYETKSWICIGKWWAHTFSPGTKERGLARKQRQEEGYETLFYFSY